MGNMATPSGDLYALGIIGYEAPPGPGDRLPVGARGPGQRVVPQEGPAVEGGEPLCQILPGDARQGRDRRHVSAPRLVLAR